jgi:DNA-directed RNA polymerase subunit K/omega
VENNSFIKRMLGTQEAKLTNVYEEVMIVAKRARQIVEHRREEFANTLERMGILEPSSDQLISTEGWQEMLSKTYEKKPSPVEAAKQELIEGKLSVNYLEVERSFYSREEN